MSMMSSLLMHRRFPLVDAINLIVRRKAEIVSIDGKVAWRERDGRVLCKSVDGRLCQAVDAEHGTNWYWRRIVRTRSH